MPALLEWKSLSGEAIDALPRERTIVYVTSSPLEVHGPHLPVITDCAEADALFERIAEKLQQARPELQFVRLPAIYVAADVVPQVGSLRFRQGTIRRVFEDLGRSLTAQGFKHIWVGGFHGGPRHFVSVEQACETVNRRHGGQMLSLFSLLLQHITGGRTDLVDILSAVDGVSRESLIGDNHGGVVETSMMLRIVGEWVKKDYVDLPQRTVDGERVRQGKQPFDLESKGRPKVLDLLRRMLFQLRYYEDISYAGDPKAASPELGEAFLDLLSDHGVMALEGLLDGRLTPKDAHSPVWKLRWFFTNEVLSSVLEHAVGYRRRVW